jgi:RND family efflux transporter MFP subunit
MKWHLVVVALSLVACQPASHDAGTATTAVAVGVGMVSRDTLTETLDLVGRLTPLPGASAQLTATADAVVRRVAVQVGQRVGKGALLVELDVPELVTQARSLQAAAAAAELDATRQRELFRQGITSRRQLEEREAAATSSRSAAEAASRLLDRSRITSPLAGGVQRVLVQPGERVSAGQPLVEVINRSSLDLVASAAPPELARLAVGQRAMISGDGGTAPEIGRVHAIAPGVDSLTGAGVVVIRILSAGPALRPGGAATARVALPVLHDALLVPDSALVRVAGTMAVFVIGVDSVIHAKAVEVKARNTGRAAVQGELRAGDRVATTGAYGLMDGMHVVPAAGPAE